VYEAEGHRPSFNCVTIWKQFLEGNVLILSEKASFPWTSKGGEKAADERRKV
jgi:hypothetical protein